MTAKLSILSGLLCLAAAGLSGCSLMHDDLEPCPSGVDLKFVYDYNIQRADMFPDHVGSVTVYVFDQNGNAVGEPLLGGIDNADNLAQLQKNIDAALAADQK